MTPVEQLVGGIAEGQHASFQALVREQGPSLLRFVRGLTPSQEAAEDVLQEALVDILRGAAGYRGGDARAWMFRIARNAAYRSHRRRVGQPDHFEPLAELGARAGWGADSLDEHLDAAERRACLRRALRRLEPSDREILVLREIEGFTGAEVASMLELSIPAMKSRLHRARLRLAAAAREEACDAR
jgi:RNA polymerase sigma-70 factor (ECF subfamily)